MFYRSITSIFWVGNLVLIFLWICVLKICPCRSSGSPWINQSMRSIRFLVFQIVIESHSCLKYWQNRQTHVKGGVVLNWLSCTKLTVIKYTILVIKGYGFIYILIKRILVLKYKYISEKITKPRKDAPFSENTAMPCKYT